MPKPTGQDDKTTAQGSPAEVFLVFLKLGLTSFGGPIAHLGYFRDELVTRRRWLGEQAYADVVALCQFLPGPASSQVGFVLGMMRAGWAGGLAAFIAFTLPSALLLVGFALTATSLSGPIGAGALHGLKVVAVAIVAQAVWGMARNLCPDRERGAIAVMAVVILALAPASLGMILAIIAGLCAGLMLARGNGSFDPSSQIITPVTKLQAGLALVLFVLLSTVLTLFAGQWHALDVTGAFFRAGALVFGGGHVVLPLLEAEVVAPGWITEDQFLAGYGAAQAVPGPLFTFAAYLGALLQPGLGTMAGAVLATMALFLPGGLLLVAALPFWGQFRQHPKAQSAMQGVNAAVVGILGAALYTPVFTSAIHGMQDFALALASFAALVWWRAAPWQVVLFAMVVGSLAQLV